MTDEDKEAAFKTEEELARGRNHLDNTCTPGDVESEVEWIEAIVIRVLDWHDHDLQHLFANRDASEPLIHYLEATEIGNKRAEKDMERTEEERNETWGWNELEEDPAEREREEASSAPHGQCNSFDGIVAPLMTSPRCTGSFTYEAASTSLSQQEALSTAISLYDKLSTTSSHHPRLPEELIHSHTDGFRPFQQASNTVYVVHIDADDPSVSILQEWH